MRWLMLPIEDCNSEMARPNNWRNSLALFLPLLAAMVTRGQERTIRTTWRSRSRHSCPPRTPPECNPKPRPQVAPSHPRLRSRRQGFPVATGYPTQMESSPLKHPSDLPQESAPNLISSKCSLGLRPSILLSQSKWFPKSFPLTSKMDRPCKMETFSSRSSIRIPVLALPPQTPGGPRYSLKTLPDNNNAGSLSKSSLLLP